MRRAAGVIAVSCVQMRSEPQAASRIARAIKKR